MKRKPIDITEKKLLKYFNEEWEDCIFNETSSLRGCQILKKKGYCDFAETNLGKLCTFSHHPAKIYDRESKPSQHYLKNDLYFQRWVLKFGDMPLFTQDEFLIEQRLNILRDPPAKLIGIVQEYKKERDKIENGNAEGRKVEAKRNETQKKAPATALPITKGPPSAPDSLEEKLEVYRLELRQEHKAFTDEDLSLLLSDLSPEQLEQVNKFLPIETITQQNRAAFNDLVLKANSNELKFLYSLDSISLKLTGIIESQAKKRPSKKEKLIGIIQEFFSEFPDPLNYLEHELVTLAQPESQPEDFDIPPQITKVAAAEAEEKQSDDVQTDSTTDSFRLLLDTPDQLYQHYREICEFSLINCGCEEEDLKELCEACDCSAHRHPSFFQCKKCPGEKKFCLVCIQEHKYGDNKIARKHEYYYLCPICLNYREIFACVDCPELQRLKCQTCHNSYHNRATTHTFNMRELPSLVVKHVDSVVSNDLPPLKEEHPPFELSLDRVNRKNWEIEPTQMDSALQEKLNNQRVVVLLASVVKPILVVLFQVVWCLNRCHCIGCKRSHEFEEIKLEPCISALLLDTKDEDIQDFSKAKSYDENISAGKASKLTGESKVLERPALRAYKNMKKDRLCTFDCNKFDYSALIEVLYCFCHRRGLNVYMYLSKQQKEDILYWRNETFHQDTLLLEMKEKAFNQREGLPGICSNIRSHMNSLLRNAFNGNLPVWYAAWQSSFDLTKKVKDCSEAYTLLEIQEELKKIWMKSASEASLRDLRRCLSLSKGSFDLRSKQLASLLIDRNVVKLLILPRFEVNGFDRLKYQFLTYIDWVGIIDLNDPFCWGEERGNDEFQPNRLVYSAAHLRPSLSSGDNKILYGRRLTSDLAGEIHRKLRLNDDLMVFVVASGGFSLAKLNALQEKLEDVKDESEQKKWNYEIIPIYENYEDLMNPTNWLGQNPTHTEQMERIQKETCSLYSLNSFILANVSRESRFILKGLNNQRFGFQSSVIPFGVDLWVDEGDKLLLEEEVKRRELSSEGSSVDYTKEVLRDSLETFLRGGPAEKYLFARGMVVNRNDLSKLISRVKERDTQSHTPITVVHGKGKGGTTIARHALYLLQQEGYVCMEIKNDRITSADFVRFLNLLAEAMGTALIKIVVYFDLNIFADRPSTLMHEILHGDCNAFTTVLETTSTRTFRSDSSSSVMKLTPDLEQDEPDQFSKLLELCVDRWVSFKGHRLPLNEFGELDTKKILRDTELCAILKKSTRADLSSARLTPSDVTNLKEALRQHYDDFEDDEYSHYVIDHDRHKPAPKMSSVKRRLHFLAMRAYVPQFRGNVRSDLNDLLRSVNPASIRVLKLCVFYTLFTHLRVPIKIAEYFYQDKYPFDFYSKSDAFSTILKTDGYLSDLIYIHDEGQGKAKISILNTHLAYCLAECSALFGCSADKSGSDSANASSASPASSRMIDSERLQVSIERIRSYIEDELFESLFGQNMKKLHAEQRFYLLCEVGPGLLDAFCKFQIWHPGTVPERRDRKTGLPKPREIRNSFLIEAFRIIAGRSRMPNRFQIIRDWFRRIVDAYREMKKETSDPEIMEYYLTFTTYACRNIAFEAASTHDEHLIALGKELLDPFEKNYQVADALGNLSKHHLLIFKYKLCPRPGSSYSNNGNVKAGSVAVRIDFEGVVDDDGDDDDSLSDDDIPSKEQNSLSIEAMKQKLEEILEITKEGYFWFEKAAFFSNFSNSNPMVSAAQIITVCLETVRAIITSIGDAKDLLKSDKIERFITYLKKPKNVAYFKDFLMKLNKESLPDKCSAMLTQAKNSIYAGKRSFYEHYAKIRTTERLIARCNDQLTELTVNPKTFAYMSKTTMTFPIIEAKLILGGDLDAITSTSALAWCIVACLKWIAEQHGTLTETLAKEKVDIETLEVIEKYFIASALLTGLTTAKFPSSPTPDEELERYLKSANLTNDTSAKVSAFMEAVLEKWRAETIVIREFQSSLSASSSSLEKRHSVFDDSGLNNDRSYYGLKGRLMQIMIYIWKILYGNANPEHHDEREMNVAKLEESLKEMYAFTTAREDANKPRRFICQNVACSRIMPFNPFLHYFFIEGSSIGVITSSKALKENPILREQEYRKTLYQEIFVTFHGTIIPWKSSNHHHHQHHRSSFPEEVVPKYKRFTIKCHELSSSSSSLVGNCINIGFADKYYKDMGFQENDEVSFVIGLTDRGIRAFGVKKVNVQR